jgi:simple sugar transport system permease protein
MRAIAPGFWAAMIALGACSLLISIVGRSPLEVYRLLLVGTWGNAYGIGQVLFKTTPLIFTGLSVALALRAGLFNIGAEGQLTIGAFFTAMVGVHLRGVAPVLAVSLCLICGFAGGALVGAIPGILKATRGAHEVINTIMLNFIVRAAMVGVGLHAFERESIHTKPIQSSSELPRLYTLMPAFAGSALNASIFIALGIALATAWFLYRTTTGFNLRAVGEAPAVAETAGVRVGRTFVLAMALSGGIAGLVGANFVLGYKHYYEDGFSGGMGYMGIAVAVLGRNHPVGVIVAALLFGTLSQGALAVNAIVPKEIVDILQAVIIMAVLAVAPEVRRLLQAKA